MRGHLTAGVLVTTRRTTVSVNKLLVAKTADDWKVITPTED